jgi:hypothetical protein
VIIQIGVGLNQLQSPYLPWHVVAKFYRHNILAVNNSAFLRIIGHSQLSQTGKVTLVAKHLAARAAHAADMAVDIRYTAIDNAHRFYKQLFIHLIGK